MPENDPASARLRQIADHPTARQLARTCVAVWRVNGLSQLPAAGHVELRRGQGPLLSAHGIQTGLCVVADAAEANARLRVGTSVAGDTAHRFKRQQNGIAERGDAPSDGNRSSA